MVGTDEEGRRIQLAYGATLLLVITSVLVSIAAPDIAVWEGIAGVLQGFALLATLQVSRVSRKAMRRASVLAAIAMLVAAGIAVAGLVIAPVISPLLWALIVLGTMVAIVRHISTFGRVDLQTVMGLLSVYVLFGLFFAYLFMIAGTVGHAFFNDGSKDAASYVYFSYVTLATVGYGDLTPAAGVPRALAVTEAIVGQLYLVSVVALAMSRVQLRREL